MIFCVLANDSSITFGLGCADARSEYQYFLSKRTSIIGSRIEIHPSDTPLQHEGAALKTNKRRQFISRDSVFPAMSIVISTFVGHDLRNQVSSSPATFPRANFCNTTAL